jgi:hypothetical protein
MPGLQEIQSYVFDVFSQWWTLVGVLLAILGLMDFFRGKSFLISRSLKLWGSMMCLVAAQFLAYKGIREQSETRAQELQIAKSTLCENEKRFAEKDKQIEDLRALLDKARTGTTAGPPRNIGHLSYLPEAISTGRKDLPHGVQITIQTNAPIQPIALRLQFSGPIYEGSVRFTEGLSPMFGVATQASGTTFTFSIDGPAFTPGRSLTVTVFSKAPVTFERAERAY